MSEPSSPQSPHTPSNEEIERIMKEQEEKLLKSKAMNKMPQGRPLLLANRAKNRTYWDSTQEGAFSKPAAKCDDERLTIIGKIQRTKLHARPEYKFENDEFIEMKTERCIMRPMDPNNKAEVDMLLELFSDATVSRGIPSPLTESTILDTQEKAILVAEKSRRDFKEKKTGFMTISDKNTDVLIGVTGIFPIVVFKETNGRVPDNSTFDPETMKEAYEIVFALLQTAWGKGFATECVLALEDLTGHLGLDKKNIFAYIDPKLCKSDHVLKKIGMEVLSPSVEYRGEEGLTLYGFK